MSPAAMVVTHSTPHPTGIITCMSAGPVGGAADVDGGGEAPASEASAVEASGGWILSERKVM